VYGVGSIVLGCGLYRCPRSTADRTRPGSPGGFLNTGYGFQGLNRGVKCLGL
jgi:hypothetical protein